MHAHLLILLLCLSCAALTECQRRRIEQLPRLSFHPNFIQYSGYLTSTDGRRLFYWLVESSEVAPADAPLVLWLNGGPGCSSVGGLLMTNGPFLANDRAELDRNELAWNRLANMLYIDSPNGVGLSEPGPVDPSVLNDGFTTELNLGALWHFFSLFPEYRGRSFYIAGESYAGIYIPLLAHAIQRSRDFPGAINLKGIAVGNGLHVPFSEHIFAANSFTFLSEGMGMAFSQGKIPPEMSDSHRLNWYNVAKPCHQQVSHDGYPCLNSTGLETYLNDARVRRALGVDESVSGVYNICVSVFDKYRRTARDVLPELVTLATGGIHVLLYHGTLDMVIPASITQTLLKKLPSAGSNRAEESVWYYNARESDGGGRQVGGLQKVFMGGRLRYLAVLGAGHSVPTDRPEMGFQILADFLNWQQHQG